MGIGRNRIWLKLSTFILFSRCRRDVNEGRIHHSQDIYNHLNKSGHLIPQTDITSYWDGTILETMAVRLNARLMRRGRWLVWSKSVPGLLKLNTDGSKSGDNAAGGEVLRDANRDLL